MSKRADRELRRRASRSDGCFHYLPGVVTDGAVPDPSGTVPALRCTGRDRVIAPRRRRPRGRKSGSLPVEGHS